MVKIYIRLNAEALLVPTLIAIFIVLSFPLMQTVIDRKALPRAYDWEGYWGASLSPCSSLNAMTANATITLGNDASKGNSWVTYEYSFLPESFLGHTIKNKALNSNLELITDVPLSTDAPRFTSTKVGWCGNLSAISWRQGGGKTDMKFNGSRLDLSANFNLGERSTYLWWTPEEAFKPINSTEYPYVVARWRSTGHVARLCVFSATEEFKVIVETLEGVIDHPARDYGGGYSPNWTTTVYRLPPNKTITRMDIGLDSGEWDDVGGEQHVEFDYIMLAQGTLEATHVKVVLNGETIFDKELIHRFREGKYSWNPDILWPTGRLTLPLDTNLLRTENVVNCSVEGCAQWRIRSVSIFTRADWGLTRSIVEMHPYQALIAFPALLLIASIGIYKLFYWAHSAGGDQYLPRKVKKLTQRRKTNMKRRQSQS